MLMARTWVWARRSMASNTAPAPPGASKAPAVTTPPTTLEALKCSPGVTARALFLLVPQNMKFWFRLSASMWE